MPSICSGFSGGFTRSMSSARWMGFFICARIFTHSRHSPQLLQPRFVPRRRCIFPFRVAPGMRVSLDGFLFCVSIWMPFDCRYAWSSLTRAR